MDEMNDIMQATHIYRRQLAEIEKRNGKSTQDIVDNPFKTTGEERQMLERIDADLTAAELRAQNKALEARLAKLESQPTLESKASSRGIGDRAGDEYAQRWIEAVRRRDNASLRALNTGSTANPPIPVDMERRIVMKMQQANVLRAISTVSTIDSDRTVTVEGALPTTALVTEANSISNSDPGFTQVSVTPYKFATRVIASQEWLDDAIGMNGIGGGLDYIADRCALSVGLKTEEYFTTGTGSGQPQGICDTSGGITQGVDLGTAAALTTVTADNVIDTVHSVAPQYRASPSFRWFLSDTMLKTIRKLKDSAGYYVFSPAAAVPQTNAVGLPGTIYGVPYSVGQYVPTATANGNIYAVVGDFRYFEIFDRTGIQSLLDPYSAAANLNINLYLWTRTDSKIMNPDAFAAIIG